jgi:hypothetical protein
MFRFVAPNTSSNAAAGRITRIPYSQPFVDRARQSKQNVSDLLESCGNDVGQGCVYHVQWHAAILVTPESTGPPSSSNSTNKQAKSHKARADSKKKYVQEIC